MSTAAANWVKKSNLQWNEALYYRIKICFLHADNGLNSVFCNKEPTNAKNKFTLALIKPDFKISYPNVHSMRQDVVYMWSSSIKNNNSCRLNIIIGLPGLKDRYELYSFHLAVQEKTITNDQCMDLFLKILKHFCAMRIFVYLPIYNQ